MTAPADGATTSNMVTLGTSTPTFTTGTSTTSIAPTLTLTPSAAPAIESTAPASDAPEEKSTKPRRSLEDTLAALPEEDRTFVLDAVRNARSEAKNLRERAKSADDVRTELQSSIAKALGLETEQPPDPAELSRKLVEETGKSRQAQVELAVFRAASQANGNPAALLDSVSFVRSLADVSPTDVEAIAEKVKAAVAANPALGTQPVRRAPGHSPAAGTSEAGAMDLDAEIAAAQKAGDSLRVIRLQNQKLFSSVR